MNRLTEKGKYSEPYESKSATACINKLGHLENIEESLGCPLEVVFKALENGIYIKDMCDIGIGNTSFGVRLDTQNYDCEYVLRTYKGTIDVCVKDYQKTWWLKEDKTE